MNTRLDEADLTQLSEQLSETNRQFAELYPGNTTNYRPVHTVYGGAHLYKPGVTDKLAKLAEQHFDQFAANFVELAKALQLAGHDDLPVDPDSIKSMQNRLQDSQAATHITTAIRVYNRVKTKLVQSPIADQRIDFEDGYGCRSDQEEDGHAIAAAEAMAEMMQAHTLPAGNGIRIKAFSEESKMRSLRSLDLFVTTLATLTHGTLPQPFYVTLPKVTTPEQVSVLVSCLQQLEEKNALQQGVLKIELMIETVQSLFDTNGHCTLPSMVKAGAGRVSTAVLGTFDYTSSCDVAAHYQQHQHPSADFARMLMQASFTGTEVSLCDGITNIMPIPPYRGEALTDQQREENKRVVHNAWRIHFENIMHSLKLGFYQGWDLNPAQIPIRYAAVYYFFLTGLADAQSRLKTFIDQAAQASMVGNTFDDAASAQGLLNFFVNGIRCGALTEDEALQTGITIDELHGRSFLDIVNNRAEASNE